MARPFFFFEIHPIFVSNFREKVLIFARDFGQDFFFPNQFFQWLFSVSSSSSLPLPPAVVQKKNYIYLPCGQLYHHENKLFFFFFFIMAGKTHFVFRVSVNFFANFVAELVTLVNPQSISSFVKEFTVVKFPVIFITVVIVPFFDRNFSFDCSRRGTWCNIQYKFLG